MFRNHFKFAIRIFLKDGVYSVLNILGLTLGIAVGILLLLYLQSEFSFDKHHAKKDQIYRLTHHLKAEGADFDMARTARELAPLLKEEFPEVLNYVRFNQYQTEMVIVNPESEEPKQFYENRIVETDSSLLSVFSHEVYEGDSENCLTGPGKVVLTKSIAKKYYGTESALGRVIWLPNGNHRTVSAVISDLPDNSHLKYDILLSDIGRRSWVSDSDEKVRKSEGFWNPGCYTYLLMPKAYEPIQFETKFEIIYDKYFKAFGDKIGGSATAVLQPLESIHFESKLDGDEPIGDIKYVYTAAIVGLFIMLLACINYINLATARSVVRTKEMGVRKVLGYSRLKLFYSVLMEALILAVFAMILAVVVDFVVLEVSPFNSWIEKSLSLNFLSNPTLLFGTIGITMLIGLMSGVYPALYIPSIPAVTALKGAKGHKSGTLLRKLLIMFQFVVSIFVIISTVLMDRQIEYLKDADIGFEKENVILINVQDTLVSNKLDVIKAELMTHSNIVSAALAWGVPGRGVGGQVYKVERDGEMVQQNMNVIWTGFDYIKTMGLKIIAGRDFTSVSEAEYNKSIIINETAAKEMGWAADPLNKRIRHFHSNDDMHVVGVVKDFNFESLHNKIKPLFLMLGGGGGGTLNIKVKGNDLETTIAYLETTFAKFDPNHPFEYEFLDQEFEKQYRADQVQHQMISSLSYICIFISILGLIGLSAFTAGQKIKEISIRKSLGASIGSILYLFSKDYVIMIVIAFLISIPLADYVIVDWLAGFAYQLTIQWYYYVLPGFLILSVGLLTVIIQSLNSARANPIDGLRNE